MVPSAIADGLAERGHDVEVLTGFPNYPDGKVHKDYPIRSYRRDERSARVTVHRAPLYPSHDKSSYKRILNYSTFAAAASWVGRRHIPQPDAWLVYSSPATAALPALLRANRTTIPFYLLIEDLWPESVTQSGFVTGAAKAMVEVMLHRFCNWSYDRAAGIGVISPSMRGLLIDRGVDERKISYTPNWVDASQVQLEKPDPAQRHTLGLPCGRVFMYAGNMGELQGLEPLVRAFAQVPDARLILIGSGVARPRLENLVKDEHILNVSFLDPQPTAVIGRYIAASDIQVVSLQDSPLLRATMPSKVQGSLAAGKPVLFHGAGDVATLVTDNRLGLACRPGELTATMTAIETLATYPADALAEMGERARAYYEQEFSASAGLDKLERLLMDGQTAGGARSGDINPLNTPLLGASS